MTNIVVLNEDDGDKLRISCNKRTKKASIKTMPYPGFPTDMQPQTSLLLTLGDSTGTIIETIWESRFQYTDELNKMGADISAHGSTAVFKGVDKLYGAPVKAHDLRAGAAMIIAGLVAEGETEISDIHHIQRGYENIIDKFAKLGAKIDYVKTEDEE